MQVGAFQSAYSRNDAPTVKERWIENGSRRIYGIESVPSTGNKHGVAIVSHGFNGTHHSGATISTLSISSAMRYIRSISPAEALAARATTTP